MTLSKRVHTAFTALLASALFAFLTGTAAFADEFTGLSTTLDECISLALERNYKLKGKRVELEGVVLQAKAITISILPKLDLKAGASYTTPLSKAFNIDEMFPPEFWDLIGGKPETTQKTSNEFQTSWGATLSASYPFTTPYVNEAIESELLARKEEVKAIADNARSAVTQAYMAALLTQRSTEVAEKSLELANEQHRNAQLRYENKVAAWFEVVQADVQVSLATEKFEQARNARRNSLKALYLAIGLSSGPDELVLEPGPIETIRDVIDEIENTEIHGFPEAFVEDSYTCKQLRYSIESLESQIDASRNLPELSGYATWAGQDGNAYQEPNTYIFGVNLNFRLFDSGEAENRMAQLEKQQEILTINRDEFAQGYMNHLEVLSNDLQVALLTYNTANKTLVAATEGLKIATIGYKEGVTTSLELMDSRTQYLNAELNLFMKKVEIFLAYDAIKYAIGYERYDKTAVRKPAERKDETTEPQDDKKNEFPALEIGKPNHIPGS